MHVVREERAIEDALETDLQASDPEVAVLVIAIAEALRVKTDPEAVRTSKRDVAAPELPEHELGFALERGVTPLVVASLKKRGEVAGAPARGRYRRRVAENDEAPPARMPARMAAHEARRGDGVIVQEEYDLAGGAFDSDLPGSTGTRRLEVERLQAWFISLDVLKKLE